MKLYALETGLFKLDGGAMFGVVPKSIWHKTNPADSNNMCTWSMRCLLIEDANRLILIDTGIGDKQSEKFLGHYYLHGDATLAKSLAKLGFGLDDITDVFFTHLHFDHCGGGIIYSTDRTKFQARFPKANYWSNKKHWNWAMFPNAREKASFLKENLLPIQELGHLKFIEDHPEINLFSDIIEVNGHTEAQMLPIIQYKNHKIIFMADLLPSIGHIPLPYIMAYDTRPLLSLQEKEGVLKQAAAEQIILFLEHDPLYECCTLKFSEKGVVLQDTGKLNEWIS